RLSEAPKQGGARLRRPTIVGGLVALAAAAGMLAAYFHNGRAPIAPSHGSELSSAPSPAASPVAEMTSAAAETVATLPAQNADAMPRILPPDYSAQETAIDAALQQAADIHPELVEGPEADGLFAATLLIRADRSLVHSVVRMIPAKDLHTPQDLHVDELAVPFEASQFPGYRKKGAVLPDGRSLRAETSLQLG